MKNMHLFAGHGGGLLCDLILGHTPIVAVEWDKYACQVLRARASDGWFPGLQVWEGDVRLFDPSKYTGSVDCIHAGFPCQDISTAGKQAGIGPETRSGLYREVIRIAGMVRPKQLFLENVSAIVANGLGTVLADLAALGYDSEWLCLRASDCGANHYRDRWWLLANAYNDSKSACSIHDEAQRMQESCKANASNADCAQPQRMRSAIGRIEEFSNFGMGSWWKTKPAIHGVDDGVANGLHRLKGLGNAQVPLQAAVAYRLLNDK